MPNLPEPLHILIALAVAAFVAGTFWAYRAARAAGGGCPFGNAGCVDGLCDDCVGDRIW